MTKISLQCSPLLRAQGQRCVYLAFLQIVAQKKMVKPLLLKYGKYAGKSTITVGFPLCACDLTALANEIVWFAGHHKVEVSG